ncbi:MAG: crosslink repair DNA glycosylase YcaQ family protein, partial [Saprospiraceae bacterium]|nr:crosslink repair DNA glycosylase YcaQ family protein [Saprospiraceae bacterium]
RQRLRDLWGYDYQIECYVPGAKRKYGYFCLPLLYGDQFVGRMDAKADRKTGIMIVKHLVKEWEMDDEHFMAEWRKAMNGFLEFNGCKEYVIERTSPASLKTMHAQI